MKRFAMRGAGRWGIVLLGLVAAGCGSKGGAGDTQLGPTTPILTAEGSDELVLQLLTGVSIANGDLQTAMTSGAGGATALTAARPMSALWDTTFSGDGLTYQGTGTFYDAAGQPLPGYGPEARRLHWTSRAAGTWVSNGDTATVGHASRFDVLGIETAQDTLVINGQCLDTLMTHFTCIDGQTTKWMHWTGTLTYHDVRVLKSTRSSGGWPISGGVLLVITADRLRSRDPADVEQHLSSFILVDFDGTSQPLIRVNACYEYDWNMVTGQLVRR